MTKQQLVSISVLTSMYLSFGCSSARTEPRLQHASQVSSKDTIANDLSPEITPIQSTIISNAQTSYEYLISSKGETNDALQKFPHLRPFTEWANSEIRKINQTNKLDNFLRQIFKYVWLEKHHSLIEKTTYRLQTLLSSDFKISLVEFQHLASDFSMCIDLEGAKKVSRDPSGNFNGHYGPSYNFVTDTSETGNDSKPKGIFGSSPKFSKYRQFFLPIHEPLSYEAFIQMSIVPIHFVEFTAKQEQIVDSKKMTPVEFAAHDIEHAYLSRNTQTSMACSEISVECTSQLAANKKSLTNFETFRRLLDPKFQAQFTELVFSEIHEVSIFTSTYFRDQNKTLKYMKTLEIWEFESLVKSMTDSSFALNEAKAFFKGFPLQSKILKNFENGLLNELKEKYTAYQSEISGE